MKYCGLHTSKRKLVNVHNGSLHHCRENTDEPYIRPTAWTEACKIREELGSINVGNMQKERAGVKEEKACSVWSGSQDTLTFPLDVHFFRRPAGETG